MGTTLDALLSLPEIADVPVGTTGGLPTTAILLAVLEPRISAAVFFGMGFVRHLVEEAQHSAFPFVPAAWDTKD